MIISCGSVDNSCCIQQLHTNYHGSFKLYYSIIKGLFENVFSTALKVLVDLIQFSLLQQHKTQAPVLALPYLVLLQQGLRTFIVSDTHPLARISLSLQVGISLTFKTNFNGWECLMTNGLWRFWTKAMRYEYYFKHSMNTTVGMVQSASVMMHLDKGWTLKFIRRHCLRKFDRKGAAVLNSPYSSA